MSSQHREIAPGVAVAMVHRICFFPRAVFTKFLVRMHRLSWREMVLAAILLTSAATRTILALKGGQFYDSDEFRYLRCFAFLGRLAAIDLRGIARIILSAGDHVGFIFTGVPAAIVHIMYLGLRGLPDTQSSVVATVWVSALCFTLPSVLSIALVYAIDRRVGATSAEALLAAFLMACSNSMFYYSRHLEPYDLSMALTLFALWLGLRENPTAWRLLSCGFIAGMGMLTYNGYWILSIVVLGVVVFYRVSSVAEAATRIAPAFMGAVSGPAVLILMSVLAGGPSYLTSMKQFAGTVTQGDFHEGAALPWLYLWDTEHALVVAWFLAALLTLWYCATDGWHKNPFVLFSLGAVAVTYGLLVLSSVGMSKFVVYGRFVRQLIPWFCLACAGSILRAFPRTSRGRIGLVASATVLAIQAAYNMSGPLRQRFPIEVRRMVQSRYGDVNYDVSFVGPHAHLGLLPDASDTRRTQQHSEYVLVNAQLLYPLRGWKPPISGDVLLSIPHPLAYRPYRYEGLSPQERDLLLHGDYSIRLVRRAAESGNPPQPSK